MKNNKNENPNIYKYIISINIGTNDIISEILGSKYPDLRIEEMGTNYMIFSTKLLPKHLQKHPLLINLRIIYRELNLKTQRVKILTYLARQTDNFCIYLKQLNLTSNDYSYRIIFNDGNPNPSTEEKLLIEQIYNRLSKYIKIDKGSPTSEIQISTKQGQSGIFIRVGNTREGSDILQSNSLRKEIAYIMNYLSEPSKKDTFIDPFCGGGIIPISRGLFWDYDKIIASDIDTSKIQRKLINIGFKTRSFKVLGCSINNLSTTTDMKFNKIVTDIPWGKMSKIEDLEELYITFIRTSEDILVNKSIIVILIEDFKSFDTLLRQYSKYLKLTNKLNIQVSGKNSYICKYIYSK